MSQVQTLHPDAFVPPATSDSESGDWWSQCATADLKRVVSTGPLAGDRFTIASRELERRATAASYRCNAEADAKRALDRQRVREFKLSIVAMALLFALFTLWMAID